MLLLWLVTHIVFDWINAALACKLPIIFGIGCDVDAYALIPVPENDAFKLLIKAKRGNDRQVSELLVTTDGTTAVATEYGVVTTNGILANYEVAMNSNSIQLSVIPTSASTTTYKALYTLLEV